MSARQRCNVLQCALYEENHEIAKMLCEELYDPENELDLAVYGVLSCCMEGKGIDLVKCVINTEIADKMNERKYNDLVEKAIGEGRVDILKYLEEEVRPIPYVERLVQQYANDASNREVSAYLEQVMNQREG
ncbi:predicted protein [Chaetoceros tenuissimus]|uniref:Uncharacterized protein n=1 Tax=Chaetoceros tenuissimus TaxID=426638 RepID=A0AAD3HG47_9STRA|nr:predicted protein [Chaetoceros tenuissimus]